MTIRFSARISRELRQRLQAAADAERRSLNDLIIVLLEEALSARDEPKKRRTRP